MHRNAAERRWSYCKECFEPSSDGPAIERQMHPVTLQVLIELQKLSITGERPDPADLDSFCQSQMEKHRKHALEVLKRNVEVARGLLKEDKGPVL